MLSETSVFPSDEMNEIIDVLDRAVKWLVLSHEKPDGDTTGCAAAVARLGIRLSKEVTLGGPDPCHEQYEFLLDGMNFRILREIPAGFIVGDSAIICLDTSTADRAVHGVIEASSSCPVINIDHHPDNERFGTVNWIDATASATGEMITEMLSSSPWGVDKQEAEALYVAIVTDNGDFRFPSATVRSHECAISLMESGAVPSRLAAILEASLSSEVLRLWGRALSRTELFAGGRAAVYWLGLDDFEANGVTRGDTNGLVNFLLKIKGVRLAALCSETDDGVRVNLRTRPPFSARDVAVVFGGGGHELASGCTIKAPMSEALALLRLEMERNAARHPAD